MSLLPTGVVVSPGNPYFAPKVTDDGTPSSGLATNITWSIPPGVSNALLGKIVVPGMTATDVVQCTLQPELVGNQNIADCINCWLIASTAGTDQILVYIANGGGGTNGQPVNNATFGVAWAVVA